MSENKKSKLWQQPKTKWLLGIPLGGFLFAIIGALGFIGVTAGFHASSTNDFCASCHIGMDTVVEEYQQSIHFKNRVGVVAECQDCHIPKEPIPYLITKVTAAKDIWYKLTRGITLENFESEHRERLANHVWDTMREQGSSTCMSCHNFDNMDLDKQGRSAQRKHPAKRRKDKTCIDCHSGVAHKLPEENLDDLF